MVKMQSGQGKMIERVQGFKDSRGRAIAEWRRDQWFMTMCFGPMISGWIKKRLQGK
jgi:hypothetical protein